MTRLTLLALVGLTACSQSVTSGQEPARREHRESSEVVRAKIACGKFDDHGKMDVGISAYESCLGQRANLTHPANRELCALARSRMSADGTCALAE
jgi:hypothetical protein